MGRTSDLLVTLNAVGENPLNGVRYVATAYIVNISSLCSLRVSPCRGCGRCARDIGSGNLRIPSVAELNVVAIHGASVGRNSLQVIIAGEDVFDVARGVREALAVEFRRDRACNSLLRCCESCEQMRTHCDLWILTVVGGTRLRVELLGGDTEFSQGGQAGSGDNFRMSLSCL